MANPDIPHEIGELLARVFEASTDSHVLFRVNADEQLITMAHNEAYRRSSQLVFGDRWTDPVGIERVAFLRSLGIPEPVIQADNQRYTKALGTPEIVTYETVIVLEAPLHMEARIEPIADRDGRLTHVLWTARNITAQRIAEQERAESEERLRASLDEKELLLSEIHHRVKNNLQVVDSLLHFQIEQTDAEAARTALRDARARLRTMSLVHELLYGSEQLTSIDMGNYGRELVRLLARSNQAVERVKVEVGEGDLSLPVDLAQPCGMILNELTVNALRHAYPKPRTPGPIGIWLTASETGVVVRVVDEGIGARSGDARPQGFGLRLVRRLVDQVGGTFEYEADASGTRATLAVPRP